MGNPWRGDDAAGVDVAARVGGRVHSGDCVRLVDDWTGLDDVVVVDAGAPAGSPGRVSRFDAVAAPLPAARSRSSSTHAFGVAEAVELGRALDRLPARLEIVVIEGADFSHDAPLSPAVGAAVEAVAAALSAVKALQ